MIAITYLSHSRNAVYWTFRLSWLKAACTCMYYTYYKYFITMGVTDTLVIYPGSSVVKTDQVMLRLHWGSQVPVHKTGLPILPVSEIRGWFAGPGRSDVWRGVMMKRWQSWSWLQSSSSVFTLCSQIFNVWATGPEAPAKLAPHSKINSEYSSTK